MSDKYDNQIFRIDAKSSFMEAVSDPFVIGKIKFIMSQYDDNNKEKQRLEYYLSFMDALSMAQLITSGRLRSIMEAAVQRGTYNGKKVDGYTAYWERFAGTVKKGKSAEKVKKMFPSLPEKNGQIVISRQLKIQKSDRFFIVMRLEYSPGKEGEKGQITPAGKSVAYINIPLTEDQAYGMAELIHVSIQAYMNQYYERFSSILFPNQKCRIWQGKEQENVMSDNEKKADSNTKILVRFIEPLIKDSEGLYVARASRGKQEFNIYFYDYQIDNDYQIKEKVLNACKTNESISLLYETKMFAGSEEKFCFFVSFI